jgi:hypothetical protein
MNPARPNRSAGRRFGAVALLGDNAFMLVSIATVRRAGSRNQEQEAENRKTKQDAVGYWMTRDIAPHALGKHGYGQLAHCCQRNEPGQD